MWPARNGAACWNRKCRIAGDRNEIDAPVALSPGIDAAAESRAIGHPAVAQPPQKQQAVGPLWIDPLRQPAPVGSKARPFHRLRGRSYEPTSDSRMGGAWLADTISFTHASKRRASATGSSFFSRLTCRLIRMNLRAMCW